MTRVAVVYHSDSGHTKLMAEAVHEGAASVEGTDAEIYFLDRKRIVEGRFEDEPLLEALDQADAIIFGCPTYMGDVSGPMKAFLDATLGRWYKGSWSDKIAAGFTVSSTPSGDKLSALMSLVVCAMQLGMLWVGLDQNPVNSEGLNRLSFYLGVGGQAHYGGEEVAIDTGDRATGVVLGARVAKVARRLA
ncbi:MAG: flavodoxin family protein [Myxococcota bacterium]|nr:flavodoxin family protein [Myxococcota bacterium]